MTEIGSWRARDWLSGRSGAVDPPSSDTSRGAIARMLAYRALLAGLGFFAFLMAIAVVPSFVGYPTLSVEGGSMGSSLPRGSIAITRWVPAEEVQLNYVIVIKGAAQRAKIHRVVSVEERDGQVVVQTKGDANASVDPGERVLEGRVAVHTYTIPYLGYGADFARTPLGWTLLVLLPAFALALLTLRDIWVEEPPAKAVPLAVT